MISEAQFFNFFFESVRSLESRESHCTWCYFLNFSTLCFEFYLRQHYFGFGILKRLLFENGTPFVNVHVRRLLDDYGIAHVNLSRI